MGLIMGHWRSRSRKFTIAAFSMLVLGALMLLASTLSAQEGGAAQRGVVLTLNGAVTPANGNYLVREIEAANTAGVDLIIMEIDTPGGLMDSMKSIIKAMLASDTPVVTYVSPQGARSASAGLYIMYAAQVSAMAPATNTGSATPIQMGGGGDGGSDRGLEEILDRLEKMDKDDAASPVEDASDEQSGETDAAPVEEAAPIVEEPNEGIRQEPVDEDGRPVDISNDASMRGKIIEDSVAYIRGLAQLRGRNADWAEKAVRPPSASVTSSEALELGVIEIIAKDRADLLRQLDGKKVQTAAGEVTISTADMVITDIAPQAWEKILSFFANPNVAAILISLGTLGLTVELWNPGSIFPGIFGALCLALGLYAMNLLPHDSLFLIVIGLGALLLIIEAFTPSFGLIGLTGLLTLATGLWFLFPEEFRVSKELIAGIVLIGGAFLGLILYAVVGSRSHGPLIGAEAIRKREGKVDQWDAQKGKGYVIVEGERWQARSTQPLKPGDKIRVINVDGIVLVVKSASAGPAMLNRMLGVRSKSQPIKQTK